MRGERTSTTTTSTTSSSSDNNNNNPNPPLRMNEIQQSFNDVVASMQARMQELEEKEKWWGSIQEEMQKHAATAASKITLDIGGQKFATSKTTLLSQPGSFFEGMISSGSWKPDEDGSYFIDRNPELFPIILDYLRTGKVNLKKFSYDVQEDLQTELDFYKITIPEETLGINLIQDSKLLDKPQQRKIQEWLGKRKLELLYSGTRDGFAVANFHLKCDNKGPTLMVIRSEFGYLFGGYAATSWDKSGSYKTVADCFLFTLSNPHNIAPTRYFNNVNATNQVYCHQNYGPTFGSGHDIYVCNNANTNNQSYANFPHAYADTTGQGNSTFTGAKNFLVSDIEVFQVI